MPRTSEIPSHGFGLCRKTPGVRALQADIGNLPKFASEVIPNGGGGRSGSVRRGIGAALFGMRTLNRNRQLLWFTFLAGLVLAGSVVSHAALCYASWAMQPFIGEAEWVFLNFTIEFFTLFFLVFLLAGLFLCIPPENRSAVSFREGLCRTKIHLKAIAAWSLILAVAAMLLFSLYFYTPNRLPENSLSAMLFGTLYGSVNLLTEFPFNPTFNPYTSIDPLRDSGFSMAFWMFPSGIMQALTFSAINLLLVILTLFVVPLLVLEQKKIHDAVVESFALLKITWAEVTSCVLFLGMIVVGVFFTYLLVQAISGIAVPGEVATIHPENSWIAFALFYDIVLSGFALVIATVGGIAAGEIYISAKHMQNSASSENILEVI